jgi:hypothetical protein
MKFKQSRSLSFSKVPLLIGIMFGLMIALIALAQGICQEADLGYAKFGFCVPEQVDVVGDYIKVQNYTGGKDVAASITLDGNKVELHLLYPCQAPQEELERAELKPYLEAFDSILAQTEYNESVPGQVLLGQIGNMDLIAYQPVNQTIALLLMDVNMSSELRSDFLTNLSIRIIEETTPLTPGYCPDSTIPASVQETATASGTDAKDTAAATESASAQPVTGKDKMSTDINAAKEQIEKLKKSM